MADEPQGVYRSSAETRPRLTPPAPASNVGCQIGRPRFISRFMSAVCAVPAFAGQRNLVISAERKGQNDEQ